MDLLDSYSALHNYKQQNGLNRDSRDLASAYVLECQLRHKIENATATEPRETLVAESGLSLAEIDTILHETIFRLQKPDLADALALCENDGVGAALLFLSNL